METAPSDRTTLKYMPKGCFGHLRPTRWRAHMGLRPHSICNKRCYRTLMTHHPSGTPSLARHYISGLVPSTLRFQWNSIKEIGDVLDKTTLWHLLCLQLQCRNGKERGMILGLLVLVAWFGGTLGRGPHHPRGDSVVKHGHYRPSKRAPEKITQDEELLHDKEHIQVKHFLLLYL